MATACTPEEVSGLLAGLYESHGVDLRSYDRASLERRLTLAMTRRGIGSPAALLEAARDDRAFFYDLLDDLTIRVTEMFRDPDFHLRFRREAVPILSSYPLLRVWSAGCATGEEAYGLAILLEETGLYGRTQIYATDLSARAIARAKQGLYPARHVRAFSHNYQRAGGSAAFSDYYTARYDSLVMRESLRRNILFFQHDLIADHVFSTMHVIFFRNVLIYFTAELQARIIAKLGSCLVHGAFLCLGSSERLPPPEGRADLDHLQELRSFCDETRIYRRLKHAHARCAP